MIMRDSEIKTLFAKADEQVHVDEIRKQKTYYAMEKQRTPMMSTKNILFAIGCLVKGLVSYKTKQFA